MWNTFSWGIRKVVLYHDPVLLPDKANINIAHQLQVEGSHTYGKYFSTNLNNYVFFGALSTSQGGTP